MGRKTTVVWAAPVLPGKSEGWRRFCQELMGSRRREYAASRQRLGIRQETSWLVATAQGKVAVLCWEETDRRGAWQALLASERPFDRWFRRQLERFLDLSEVEGSAEEVGARLYCWQSPDA